MDIVIKMDTYYIMNARDNRELLKDKSWRADSTFLIVKVPGKKKPMIIAGSGHGYMQPGESARFIYDTGSGHRKPPYGKDQFTVLAVIEFDDRGETKSKMKLSGKSFYVMK